MPFDWSLGGELGSDLELDSILDWVWWVLDSLGVDLPSLVKAVVALVPVDMSVVSVGVTMDIQASNSQISDVSSASLEPSDLLDSLALVDSNDGCETVVEPVLTSVVVLDRDGLSSVSSRSDGSGSPVEHKPLLDVLWC